MADPGERVGRAVGFEKADVGAQDGKAPAARGHLLRFALAPLLHFPFPKAALLGVRVAVPKTVACVVPLCRIVVWIRNAGGKYQGSQRPNAVRIKFLFFGAVSGLTSRLLSRVCVVAVAAPIQFELPYISSPFLFPPQSNSHRRPVWSRGSLIMHDVLSPFGLR